MNQLKGWKATLEAETKTITKKIVALTSDLQKKRQQLDLITRLLDSEIRTNDSTPHTGRVPAIRPVPYKNPTPDEVKDRVLEILVEADRPMNIKEIHAEFVRRGLPIPGKGTPFNILVHMSREIKKGKSSRFYRTGKGTYDLRRESDKRPQQERVSGA